MIPQVSRGAPVNDARAVLPPPVPSRRSRVRCSPNTSRKRLPAVVGPSGVRGSDGSMSAIEIRLASNEDGPGAPA